MRRRRTRTTRRRSALALGAAVAALAGCGGGGDPHLERSDAAPLLTLAHRIPREGACAQARDIRRLRLETTALLHARRVPAALQESLSSGVDALVAQTPTCLPPVETAAPTPVEPEGGDAQPSGKHEHGHKEKKPHDHGHKH